jgi:hypothetical protein
MRAIDLTRARVEALPSIKALRAHQEFERIEREWNAQLAEWQREAEVAALRARLDALTAERNGP